MPTLHWINKDKTIKNVKNIPYRILRENKDLSYSSKNVNKIDKVELNNNLESKSTQLSIWDSYYKERRNCNLILCYQILESRTN